MDVHPRLRARAAHAPYATPIGAINAAISFINYPLRHQAG
jgi:hypothetical protein